MIKLWNESFVSSAIERSLNLKIIESTAGEAGDLREGKKNFRRYLCKINFSFHFFLALCSLRDITVSSWKVTIK